MVNRATIDEFLAQKTLALVGVSRDGKGFGNAVRTELAAKGYTLLLVHPEADTIEGTRCVRTVKDVADRVEGAILVTPPAVTSKLVREVAEAGIGRVWIQQGAESDQAIRYCEEHGVKVVHHQCILMFSEPAAFVHRFHRGFLRLFGRLPS
jgi:predicted CoA-binding protein